MHRSLFFPIIVLLVGGCIQGSFSPGHLPKGVASGVYTNGNPQTIATCVATALGSVVQTQDKRFIVASVRHPGLSYSVGANPKNEIYPTQIAIIGGENDVDDAPRVNI